MFLEFTTKMLCLVNKSVKSPGAVLQELELCTWSAGLLTCCTRWSTLMEPVSRPTSSCLPSGLLTSSRFRGCPPRKFTRPGGSWPPGDSKCQRNSAGNGKFLTWVSSMGSRGRGDLAGGVSPVPGHLLEDLLLGRRVGGERGGQRRGPHHPGPERGTLVTTLVSSCL